MFFTQFRLPKISLSLSKFLQMKLNSFLFRFLPFSVSRGYIAVLGRLYYLLCWAEKTLIRKTIKHVFGRKIPAPILNQKARLSRHNRSYYTTSCPRMQYPFQQVVVSF